MYEAIRALYNRKDLKIVTDVTDSETYKAYEERRMQLQMLLTKGRSQEHLDAVTEYIQLIAKIKELENEAAYINGYLWGSRLTRDALSEET